MVNSIPAKNQNNLNKNNNVPNKIQIGLICAILNLLVFFLSVAKGLLIHKYVVKQNENPTDANPIKVR